MKDQRSSQNADQSKKKYKPAIRKNSPAILKNRLQATATRKKKKEKILRQTLLKSKERNGDERPFYLIFD